MPYIYQADLWCNKCGRKIRATIDRKGHAPENPDDEHTYDSDDYPKYVFDPGESDSVTHCASHENCLDAVTLSSGDKIGALVTERLTSAGIADLRAMIRESINAYQKALHEYWSLLFQDELA